MTASLWRVRPTLGPTPQWPEMIVTGPDRLVIASEYRQQMNVPGHILISTWPERLPCLLQPSGFKSLGKN